MVTVRELLGRAAGLPGDSPRRDAEVLLCHALGQSRSWLYAWPEAQPEPDQLRRYEQLLVARGRGEPVAYLTGRREFWSLPLIVDHNTLIPRPETETLVAWALELELPADSRVLDLGTGSGAIALALASERPGWRVLGVDASEGALRVAARNRESLGLQGVRLLRSNWYEALEAQRYHLLVSNPPYVDADDDHLRQGDLRFEPREALVAAECGLADLRRVISGAVDHLSPGGHILLEHGYDQGNAVRTLLSDSGFERVATRLDGAGLERISGGQLPC